MHFTEPLTVFSHLELEENIGGSCIRDFDDHKSKLSLRYFKLVPFQFYWQNFDRDFRQKSDSCQFWPISFKLYPTWISSK